MNQPRSIPASRILARLCEALGMTQPVDGVQQRLRREMLVRTLRVGMVTNTIVLLLFLGNYPAPRPEWVLTAAVQVLFVLLQESARRGYVQATAVVTIMMMLGLIAFSPFAFQPIPSLPFFAIIPLMLTGIFFSWRAVLLSAAGLSVWHGVMYGIIRQTPIFAPPIIEPIALYIAVAGVIIVFVQHRDALERARMTEMRAMLDHLRESEAALETRAVERARALADSEQRFATLFHNSIIPIAVSTTDPDAPIVSEVNDAYLRMVGFTREELKRSNLVDLGIVIQNEARDERLRTLSTVGEYGAREIRIRRRDGQIIDVLISAQRVEIDGVPYDYEILLDITERRRLEAQQFEIALQKERMRLLRLFIQEASHEFRTPLTVIGTSAYLMARTNDAAAIARYVPRINEQVERLKRLLDGMVALTTLESGVPLEHEPIDLPMLMDAVLERAQPLLVNHRLTPDISAQGRIRGDAEWLIAALYELLKNATAYTPPGGAIALRTSVCPVDHVVRIVVEDSGVGIPEEALPYIFNHFWRADSAHTTPGFGLGLSIAGSVTELHGGEIEVESTPGQGSRFAIVLPLLRDQDA